MCARHPAHYVIREVGEVGLHSCRQATKYVTSHHLAECIPAGCGQTDSGREATPHFGGVLATEPADHQQPEGNLASKNIC
jgi:hypothetical protein